MARNPNITKADHRRARDITRAAESTRELSDAATHFGWMWALSRPWENDAMVLTCGEFDAMHALLLAGGYTDAAASALRAHQPHDTEPDDGHYTGEGDTDA